MIAYTSCQIPFGHRPRLFEQCLELKEAVNPFQKGTGSSGITTQEPPSGSHKTTETTQTSLLDIFPVHWTFHVPHYEYANSVSHNQMYVAPYCYSSTQYYSPWRLNDRIWEKRGCPHNSVIEAKTYAERGLFIKLHICLIFVTWNGWLW